MAHLVHPAVLADAALWRLLRLARRIRARAPAAGMLLRRMVLVLWWTATLQLHTQFRFWLRARRLRREAPPATVFDLIHHVDPEALALPTSDEPLVSVIIPVHGQLQVTLCCLAAIAAHAPATRFEVIVADDAGPAEEHAILRQVRGIRLLRQDKNLGFIGTCNSAAKAAHGQYLLFLNNDTQVLPGWLDVMAETFVLHDRVGAVGAKLLYPDGRLQEAGGIIWRDGSGWNFGRHDDPSRPIYNYVREVDYCSGAALMIRRQMFQRLGGFDTRYAPAYFEDSDLCFRLRELGLRTLYQPRAQVVHLEGTSHGNDLSVGVKAFQVMNRRSFVQMWEEVLRRDHYPNGQQVLRAREHARHRKVVLVVDHQIPQPDRDAGSRTMDFFLKALLASGAVVKFWPHNQLLLPGYTEALQDLGIEVMATPLRDWLREYGAAVDHILLSRPDVADAWIGSLRRHTRARISYYGHDLHFMRLRLQGEHNSDEATLRAADRMEEMERAIWRQVDDVLYPSAEEAGMVRQMEPAVTAHVVQPYGFERFGTPRHPPAGHDILFVAGFGHPPNEQALRWFAAEIFPLIVHRVPGARLVIAGSNPTAWVRALASDGIALYADIDDRTLRRLYQSARVAVVPLLSGAGVKLKVVEALREGVPLVATPVGLQGLPGLSGIASRAAHPADFAAAVVALLSDDALWEQRCAAQIAYAIGHFATTGLRLELTRGMRLNDRAPGAAVARHAPDIPAGETTS